MIVFRFDNTMDGLLTAVFDAYSRKQFPARLLVENEQIPLFCDTVYEVATDSARAERVWKGIEKKLPKNSCNMILHAWLSEESDRADNLFAFIRQVFDTDYRADLNFADPIVKNVMDSASRTTREGHRLRQFVRFQKAADGTYFAPVEPECNSLPVSIPHFVDRFGDMKWLIYDTRRKFGYYYDLRTATEVTLEEPNFADGRLDPSIIDTEENLFQEMWRGYFKAISIKERMNLKLQRQHMPKKYWKYLTEKQ